jgi:hypothetical protein
VTKRAEAMTSKSIRGWVFAIDIYEDGTVYVFRDVQRNYVEVARVKLPLEARKDNATKDAFLSRVHRYIVGHYAAQHKNQFSEIEFLPGAQLTSDEIKKGVGLVNKRDKTFLENKVERRVEPSPAARSKAASNGNGHLKKSKARLNG